MLITFRTPRDNAQICFTVCTCIHTCRVYNLFPKQCSIYMYVFAILVFIFKKRPLKEAQGVHC